LPAFRCAGGRDFGRRDGAHLATPLKVLIFRRLWPLLAIASVAAGACARVRSSSDPGRRERRAYLENAAFRREALTASLATTRNRYAETRLAHYGRNGVGGWDALREWNPAVEPIVAAEMEAPDGVDLESPLHAAAQPLAVPKNEHAADDLAALVDLGRRAFFRYPVQRAPLAQRWLTRAQADALGLWSDRDAGLGALVRTAMADGSVRTELTCATCHAAPGADGALIPGKPNAALDLSPFAPVARSGRRAAPSLPWGRGRVGVSPGGDEAPVRIPDLRPTRWLTHLQAGGAVVQRDLVALAIRIETLIITAHEGQLRPPRVIALGLAAYLWSLSASLPRDDAPLTVDEAAGQSLFAARCEGCHAGAGLTGPPRDIGLIGTDPAAGLSADRGTGQYRVPSLRGVSTRGPLLHDGSLAGLADLLDRRRLEPGFARGLHGAGPVPGHQFGLDFDATEQRQVLAYLATL
jgi:mono/diheme cytochrome c family protein